MSDIASWHTANRVTQSGLDAVLRFLQTMAEYVAAKTTYAPYKRMASWIKDGGECQYYSVQGNCKRDFVRAMEEQKVPFLLLSDENTFIVQADQVSLVQDINRKILVSKANYFQEVSIKEMEHAIASIDQIKDKSIIRLRGLDMYTVETIKNKCNNITEGFMVGVDGNPDGTYDLAVRPDKFFKLAQSPEEEEHDFCKSVLSALLSLDGPNHQTKINELEHDLKIDEEVERCCKDDKVHYITSDTNRTRYLEINENGFELYETRVKDKKRIDRQLKRVNKSDVNFYSELAIELDKMENKGICHNAEDLGNFLNDKTIRLSQRDMSDMRRARSVIQHHLTTEIDVAIKLRMSKYPNFNKLTDIQKFNLYMREAKSLLDALQTDFVPDGYTKEQMQNLKEHMETDGMRVIKGTDKDAHFSIRPEELASVASALESKLNIERYDAKTLDKAQVEHMKGERNGFYNVRNR